MNRWLIIGAAVLAVLIAVFFFAGSGEMEAVSDDAPVAIEGAVEDAGAAAEDAGEAVEEEVEDLEDEVEDEPVAPAAN